MKLHTTRKLGLIAALFLALSAPHPVHAQSVLFIGNSFTFADFGKLAHPAGGVPELFARIAREDGHTPQVQMVATPNATFRDHFENKHGEITAIDSRQWDYVVLQAHSLEPTAAAEHPGDFLEYGQKLAAVIKQNDAATKIVLYLTWPYPKGSAIFPGKFADQAGQLSQVEAGYKTLAQDISATAIAPVGEAFMTAQNGPGQWDLYAPALNHHANDTGYTLAALVIARTIYGELPANPAPVLDDVSADDMRNLAGIANDEVKGWQG